MVGHCVWILMALSIANGGAALAQQAQGINQAVPEIAALEPELESLYRDLHEHPELAFHEQRSAAKLADRPRALGVEVSSLGGGCHVGGRSIHSVSKARFCNLDA